MDKKTYNHFGTEHTAKPGAYIMMDNWRPMDSLIGGDSFSALRLPSNRPGASYAVDIKITGRTYQSFEQCMWVRIQITFLGDGGPDTYARGWLLLDDRSKV